MIFESPENVAAKDYVETLICPRRTARVTNRKVDRQPYRRGLTARPSIIPAERSMPLTLYPASASSTARLPVPHPRSATRAGAGGSKRH